jgi:hypothetical protein
LSFKVQQMPLRRCLGGPIKSGHVCTALGTPDDKRGANGPRLEYNKKEVNDNEGYKEIQRGTI